MCARASVCVVSVGDGGGGFFLLVLFFFFFVGKVTST